MHKIDNYQNIDHMVLSREKGWGIREGYTRVFNFLGNIWFFKKSEANMTKFKTKES